MNKANARKISKRDRENMDYERYNVLLASHGAFVVAIGSFVLMSVVMPFSIVNIVTGLYVVNVIFDDFFAEQFFGIKVKKAADVYCVAFLIFTMPIIWFNLGGFMGAGSLWMIFATIYCIYGTIGLSQSIILNSFAIEAIGIAIVTLRHPEFVVEIEKSKNIAICVFSLFAVATYIQIVSTLQRRQIVRNRKTLVEMQENLTANFEESLAVNEELTHMTEKLEIANQTQRSFNASMNHELRAPLNGIEGCLQILLMDDKIPDDSREMVKNALTACKTINQTVNDILDYSKLEEGKFEIIEKPFDLRDVLNNISTIFRPQANAKNLKFTIQIPTDSRIYLVGDGVRIQQVMTNLISNGIKYTKEGGVTMTVTTQRGHLKFTVKDTGQGMSEESIKVLFDPFTRFNLEQNVNIQGTGLGMNIVSNMIREMKGTINVESTLGEGSTFDVDIPIMFYDSSVTFQSPRTNDNKENASVDLSTYRVLCVDDTEINRTIFKGLLKNTGAKITTVDCGTRALKLCEQVKFDIIFLDHMMPEMDGIETLKRIRELGNGENNNTPIIIFTGNSSEEYKDLYTRSGANGYLLKPVMFDDLVNCFNIL